MGKNFIFFVCCVLSLGSLSAAPRETVQRLGEFPVDRGGSYTAIVSFKKARVVQQDGQAYLKINGIQSPVLLVAEGSGTGRVITQVDFDDFKSALSGTVNFGVTHKDLAAGDAWNARTIDSLNAGPVITQGDALTIPLSAGSGLAELPDRAALKGGYLTFTSVGLGGEATRAYPVVE